MSKAETRADKCSEGKIQGIWRECGAGGPFWTGRQGEALLRRSYLSKDLKVEEVSARQHGEKGILDRGTAGSKALRWGEARRSSGTERRLA